MKADKVYIGLYKNSTQESLFYQKDLYHYYDLKAKKETTYNDIEILASYSEIISKKNRFRNGLIKLYDMDRMKKVSLERVFLGSVFKIIDSVTSTSYHHMNNNLECKQDTSCEVEEVKNNVLLYRIGITKDLEFEDLLDMETGEEYSSDFTLAYGSCYVPRTKGCLKKIKEVIPFSEEEEKVTIQKLLLKYREYKRGNL